MFDRYRTARTQAKDIDLIPIMNLMVTLIPFLMLGAAFYHIGVIPVSVPTQVESLGEPPSEEIISVNLEMDAQELRVSAQSGTVDQAVLDALAFKVARGADGYLLSELADGLLRLKQRFPKSDTIILLPEETVRYTDIVRVLDVSRERKVGADDSAAIPLFPVTVFSKRPVAPPAEVPDAGVGPP